MCCACNLEVHIAQSIFHALDVAEHLVFSALHILNQPHGNSGHRCRNRDAGVHQRQGAAADRPHAGRAVGAEHFADQTERVGERFWDHRNQCPFGQRAMADLAAFGAAHRGCFACAEGGEVVVVHVAFFFAGQQRVQPLGVAWGAQRCNRQHMGFSAHEEAGAMDTRQIANLHADGADLGRGAPVGADSVLQDAPSRDFFEGGLIGILDIQRCDGAVGDPLGKCRPEVGLDRIEPAVEFYLAQPLCQQGRDPRGNQGVDFCLHLGCGQENGGEGLGLAQRSAQFLDSCDNLAVGFVGQVEGVQHQVFGQFIGARLDHENIVFGAGCHQAEPAGLHLCGGGVDHKFAVDKPDRRAGNWAIPRDVADRQCC